jgi:hypothetical protein
LDASVSDALFGYPGGEMNSHFFLFGALAGVLTTVTSDLGAVIGARLGVAGPGGRRGGPNIIGRWFGYMFHGKFTHTDIHRAPPLPGELPLGLGAHYVIGIIFALAFGVIVRVLNISWVAPAAFLFGLATVVFPWFLMLPAQGMGWMGRAAPPPAQATRMSLFTHLVFGLGLALWVLVLHPF